jgi:hypothetical protein
VKESDMRGAFIVHEEEESAYRMLFTTPQKNGPLGEYRRKWEDDIKMYLGEQGFETTCN